MRFFKRFIYACALLIVIGFLTNQFQTPDLYSATGASNENTLSQILKRGELQYKADLVKKLQEKRFQSIKSAIKSHELHQILQE